MLTLAPQGWAPRLKGGLDALSPLEDCPMEDCPMEDCPMEEDLCWALDVWGRHEED